MTEGIAYIDGELVDLHEARVPLIDRGYLLGDGVFETLRVSNGRPFRLDDHAARLRDGLQCIGLEPELEDEFRAAVKALVGAALKPLGSELYLRVQISTGPMDDILPGERGIIVTGFAKRFRPYPMEYLNRGVHVILSTRRKDRFDPLSRVKTLSFLPYVAARREAHSKTAHDALLRNDAGRIAEGTTSNVFAVHDGTVHAPGPDEGAMSGVTRGVVLDLLAEMDVPVVERLDVATMERATEAWLTNTTGGVVPIRRFEDRDIGEKGPRTARLQHALEDLVRA